MCFLAAFESHHRLSAWKSFFIVHLVIRSGVRCKCRPSQSNLFSFWLKTVLDCLCSLACILGASASLCCGDLKVNQKTTLRNSIPCQVLKLLDVHYAVLKQFIVLLYSLFWFVHVKVFVWHWFRYLFLFIKDFGHVQLFGSLILTCFSNMILQVLFKEGWKHSLSI